MTETQTGSKETYTGVTSRQFKKRFYEHNTDMRKVKNRTKSCLSAHIWNLKDNGKSFTVSWKLKDRATSYNPTTKKCRICLKEKYHILYKADGASLNKRSEIFNTCRHRITKLLINVKTWVAYFFFWVWKNYLSFSNLCHNFVFPDDCDLRVIWNKPVEI